MNSKFIIITLLPYIYLTFSAFADSDISLHKIRESGDSLDISIQQELNRASGLGIQWINGRQNIDGSWGESNKLVTTAICALALVSTGDKSLTPQVESGMQWITAHSSQCTLTNFSIIAWTTAAYLVTGTPGCTIELHYSKIKTQDDRLTSTESAIRREIILGLRLMEPNESLRKNAAAHYQKTSHKLNTDTQQMLQMWLDARVINRSGGGQLIDNQGRRVDWRRIFAQKIISSQLIDPQTGGFWQGVNPSQNIQNTALAILISKEL